MAKLIIILCVLCIGAIKASECKGLRVNYDYNTTMHAKIVVKGSWIITYRWVRFGYRWKWMLESVEL